MRRSTLTACLCLGLAAAAGARPLHPSAQKIGEQTQAFYKAWKKIYFHALPHSQEAYIYVNADGHAERGAGGTAAQTTAISEGQGYGLVAVALLDDAPTAQADYDRLYRYCQHHPAPQSPYLMDWNQVKGGRTAEKKDQSSSASDGDLDIAYSLFLAQARWGSRGIAYRAEALKRLEAILRFDYNPENRFIGLGSFIDKDDPKLYYGVRPSDLMTGHYRAFYRCTGDKRWDDMRTRSLKLLADSQKQFSPKAGLWPDFLVVRPGQIKVAPPDYLESETDGSYGYNACRVPWRLAVDALCSADESPQRLLAPLNTWIASACKGNPDKIVDGYRLSGARVKTNGTNSQAFVAPLALAALYGKDQKWLDACFAQVTQRSEMKDEDYFGNTIKVLCLAAFSGRWQSLDARLSR